MTTSLQIVVYGSPAPQGSKRHVGRGVLVESSKQLPVWREDVKLAALRALEDHPEWDRTLPAVSALIGFTFPRPRSHYRTGKYANSLRADAPELVGVKPDLDKLIRATGDALTAAGVWADDSRLAVVYASKRYAGAPLALDRPGAHISLQAVE